MYYFHEIMKTIDGLRQFPTFLPHLGIAALIVAGIAIFVWLRPSQTVTVMSDEEAEALVREDLNKRARQQARTAATDKPSRPRRKETPTTRSRHDDTLSNPLHPASPLNPLYHDHDDTPRASSSSSSYSSSSSSDSSSSSASDGGSFD